MSREDLTAAHLHVLVEAQEAIRRGMTMSVHMGSGPWIARWNGSFFEAVPAEQVYQSPSGDIGPFPSRVCRECHQTSAHFYTSQRDQSVLCATCFGTREAKQLAKEVQPSPHPLDAWMR